MGFRIAVDTGGTFTDLAMINEETGKLVVTKVPSTPDDPGRAVLAGLDDLMQTNQVLPQEITFLLHGTTVATNAILERKGAKIGLVTTAGFRDVLHIGRQVRPKLYDHRARKQPPLVSRQLCLEVKERLLKGGIVHLPLDEASVYEVARKLRDEQVEAIAICLMHSYANPEHELKVHKIITEICPDAFISMSADVLPEFREYERMSTIAVNAYVMPKVNRYVARLVNQLRDIGLSSDLYIMQSNGGVITSTEAQNVSARTVLSGPAGGALAGIALANQSGRSNLITADMGGTSLDICLIHESEPRYSTESEIGGCPLKLPMIEIHTIGAGGGSIAWIDSGGALRVGPQSAGAVPGPVCYQRGGQEPTVTDANVVLGRINPGYILGGRMFIDLEAARLAIQEKIAAPLGITVEAAAEGIISVVNANMVRGIRVVSVEKGYDPRDFALVPFGGAGAVHAVDMAEELGMQTVIVPQRPGITSAIGMLYADVRHDYVRTHLSKIDSAEFSVLNQLVDDMRKQAVEQLQKEGFSDQQIILQMSVDLRYEKQAYELNVPMSDTFIDAETLAKSREQFHVLHERSYGYSRRHDNVELVNLRLVGWGKLPSISATSSLVKVNEEGVVGVRPIFFAGKWIQTNVFKRENLKAGSEFEGPAVIEQLDATTVVNPGQKFYIDNIGNLVITL